MKKYIAFKAGKGGKRNGVAKATCIVDCSCEEALAWAWDYCSFERNKNYEMSLGGKTQANENSSTSFARFKRRVRAEHSCSHKEILSVKKMPKPFHHRAFTFHLVWHREQEEMNEEQRRK